MAYAEISDVQGRMSRTMSADEQSICEKLLADSALIIDAYNVDADESVKLLVSCRMAIRALGDGNTQAAPIGATQGSVSALGYSQSWTLNSGSVGELYLSKLDKRMLGVGNSIGSYSPIEGLVSSDD